ncbi:MAG: TIGR03960 family B12-binding radical SAM protein [Deltaproteobacteria bacterium]
MSNNDNHDELLLRAEKPSRYTGAEVNSIRKEKADVRFALAFPDTYEVGMSHLGFQILYSILNEIPYVAAERCFAVWPDRESQLRKGNLPLTSLECQIPLTDFDIVGFSLQYELSYTNVLTMLDLGAIPLKRADRKDGHPLIIAGGPCCFNPAPLAEFIDAFVIGEGEEAVIEIAEAIRTGKKQKLSRIDMIERLAQIPGIYVPAHHKKDQIIKKRKAIDLNLWPHPQKPVVPVMQTIHDRIILEIARGCTRGCRFCQAGMIWRPYRERNSSLLLEMAQNLLQATGHDEISLLSLSSGDYSCIEPLIQSLMKRYYASRVALALPSLRVESLTGTLIDEIKKTRKTSFTLAPEAGTDRMRQIINKGNNAADLLATVDKVFTAGWKSIKLYFMLGLPGEEQSDLEGIIDLSNQALRAAKNRGQVTISLSTFVPKPHTPFQWQSQLSADETYKRQNFIRERIKKRNLTVKWHDARMSLLEGLFSRGDEKIGTLLVAAYQKGCRFDGWGEILRFDLWQEAIQETGIDPEYYLRERNTTEALPWDNIDCGVSREFLLQEKTRSLESADTEDCRYSGCQNCGVCDVTATKNIFSKAIQLPDANTSITATPVTANAETNLPPKVYRLTFTKLDRARFFSHLELSMALIRALRRSSIELCYSAGYHPHPKISFATATSVGMESKHEYMDITTQEYSGDLNALMAEINSALPHGIEVSGIQLLSYSAKDLAQSLRGFIYELRLPADIDTDRLAAIKENMDKFMAASSFNIQRLSKGKTITKDIRPFIESMLLDTVSKKIDLTIRHAQSGSARPVDIITNILGYNTGELGQIRVVKTETILNRQ